MSKTYSRKETELMKAVRRTAETNLKARCPWCGTRPIKEKWAADHLFPLLKASSPLVAACASCNRRRQGKLPKSIHFDRLFYSDRTVRTVPAEELKELANEAADSLFGGSYWVPLLIAAVDGKRPVRYWNSKKLAVEENKKLASVVGALSRQ